MKHIMNTIKTISVGLALVFAATSCEDFFDRAPKDEFATTTFFASETDLQLYANGLIEAAMPSVSTRPAMDESVSVKWRAERTATIITRFNRSAASAMIPAGP